jgi:hypothetical protein
MLPAAERERQHDPVESHSADGDSQHKRPRAFKQRAVRPAPEDPTTSLLAAFGVFATGFLMRPAIRSMKSFK